MSEEIRLQKFIADQGICSRRQAETLIRECKVMVDGHLATLGEKVIPGKSHVNVNGKRIQAQSKIPLVLMLNKPTDYISSNDDPYNEKTVFDLIPPPWNRERLFCAGRLDKDSEGMLIITNDGDLVHKLTHPSNQIIKRYRVQLNRPFNEAHISQMLRGIEDEGELLKVERVFPIKQGIDSDKRIEIHLEHGKKREIRRILQALGYHIKRLQRFQIGKLRLKGVAPGRCRKLKKHEIEMLLQ